VKKIAKRIKGLRKNKRNGRKWRNNQDKDKTNGGRATLYQSSLSASKITYSLGKS